MDETKNVDVQAPETSVETPVAPQEAPEVVADPVGPAPAAEPATPEVQESDTAPAPDTYMTAEGGSIKDDYLKQ